MTIDKSTRTRLAAAARNRRLRNKGEFTAKRPTKWHPNQVINPAGGLDAPFTEPGAWELIASTLESGHDVEEITLRQPAGATAYVMKIDLTQTSRDST